MTSNIFQTPDSIVTGIGCFDEIGVHVGRWGKTCLLVTGEKAMQEQGIFAKAVHLMDKEGVKVVGCTGVEHDPAVTTVDRAREALNRNSCDVVLGLGGGSAIDVAKAAAGLARQNDPTIAFFDGKEMPDDGLPVIAAPTTAGTGSEVTRVSVLTDPERNLKKSIRHDCMLPKAALVDPVIGVGSPPEVTAACGMDALTQAIESYMSVHATDITRSMSFGAMMLIISSLPRAVADGHDIAARENCANGAMMAGVALHNARLGLVHGIAHPLGAHCHIAHGAACGILLPAVLRYNQSAAEEDYKLLSGIFGDDFADYCENLLTRIGMPADLKGFNIPAEVIPIIAAETMPSGSTGANPRKVAEEEVVRLLEELS